MRSAIYMFNWLFHCISGVVLVVLFVCTLAVVISFPEKVLAQEPFPLKLTTRLRRLIMCSKRKGLMFVVFVWLLVTVISFPENVLAQESFPSRPITLIIRSGVGGTADIMARLFARSAEKELGQPIVCENRVGAGGVLGVTYVLRSKPDGYTIGVTSLSTFVNSPHMAKVPFDSLTDVATIMAYIKVAHALCVRTDAPWKTFEEVIAYAQKNPGKFTYALGGGIGSAQHITMERIATKEGLNWSAVPFKSGAESVLACLGGHVNAVAASGPPDVSQHIEAGKLRLLLPLTDTRWPTAPNIPTVQERYGFYGFSHQMFYGPKALPESILEKLQNSFKKAMDDPLFVNGAKGLQVEAAYISGEEYEKLWKTQYEVIGKVIRDIGIGKK